jgi:thioredoxin 1
MNYRFMIGHLFQEKRIISWWLISRASEPFMNDFLKTVTDQSFGEQVLRETRPVLVDYWASWCGPCRIIAPMVEASAEQYAGRLTVAQLNIDENPLTPTRYAVRGIPTLMIFKNGQPVATRVGSLSRRELDAFISAHA